ncbi:MAG TPA: RIP metalloprotease RseP [Candidatus Kapabacteria bacterium]
MEHLILSQFGLEGAESFLRALLYFVITIFILVTVHEFGHFIAGRIFGMRVPVFSVGMGRRLFGFNKVNGFTLGPLDPEAELKLENNTDYRLSLLPIGGYAKIEGMIDETQNEALPSEIQSWEFRAKPWWQKSIVISAGVIMNVLLAWFIFGTQNFYYGAEAPATTTVGYVQHGSVAEDDGIRSGDRIVTIAGRPIKNWLDIDQTAKDEIGNDFSLTFERNGKIYSALFRAANMGTVLDMQKRFGLSPVGFTAPVIDSVLPATPAAKAGLLKGDSVLAVDGAAITNPSAFVDAISSHPLKPITIELMRKGAPVSIAVTPDDKGTIGVYPLSNFVGAKVEIRYGLVQSLGLGWSDLWSYARLTVLSITEIIQGKMAVSSALGGPIKIAQFASKSAAGGLETFMGFMAMLSISLALINILPIPALDGGHLFIILVEAVLGRELSQRFKLNFQKVGIAILLFLMVFMVINDIRTL